jgi:hypothetical protein
VHQDLPVFVAATPLPRPVHAVTRPPEKVHCHADLAAPLEFEFSAIARPLTRASAKEALLPTPIDAGRFVIRATQRTWGWRAVQSELGDDIS